MTKFICKDNREIVTLSVPRAGGLTVNGKFRPTRRVLELTDAQAALFAPALVAAVEAKVLFAPAGWPAPAAPQPEPEHRRSRHRRE
jgi:hypothetical protein